jgi:hypothetical protein
MASEFPRRSRTELLDCSNFGRERTRAGLAGDVAQLYMQGVPRAGIGEALVLTTQVHKILSGLFAEGMPKFDRREMSDEQVRAIHAGYVRGGSMTPRRSYRLHGLGGATAHAQAETAVETQGAA